MITFTLDGTTYEVNKIEEVDSNLKFVREKMIKSGKEASLYFASKVLKSGKKSIQGGMFYRFAKSGNFIKVL